MISSRLLYLLSLNKPPRNAPVRRRQPLVVTKLPRRARSPARSHESEDPPWLADPRANDPGRGELGEWGNTKDFQISPPKNLEDLKNTMVELANFRTYQLTKACFRPRTPTKKVNCRGQIIHHRPAAASKAPIKASIPRSLHCRPAELRCSRRLPEKLSLLEMDMQERSLKMILGFTIL